MRAALAAGFTLAAGAPQQSAPAPADTLGEARRILDHGDVAGAIASLARLLESDPTDPEAAPSRFLLADLLDRRGETDAALHQLQAVRESGSPSALSDAALDRATLIYRTRRLAATGGSAVWKLDSGYAAATSAAALKGPSALAIGADGTLWVADERADELVQLDASGGVVSRTPRDSPRFLTAIPAGILATTGNRSLGVVGATAVIPPAGPEPADSSGETGGSSRAPLVRRIGGLAAGPGPDTVLLIDESESRLLRYRPDLSFQSILYDPASGKLTGVASDPAGFVWVGLEKARSVAQIDAAGRELRRVGPFTALRDIAVDAIGNLYVLDDRERRVAIFDRQGNSLISLSLDALGLPEAQLTALAVGRTGEIYLADRRGARIVRLG